MPFKKGDILMGKEKNFTQAYHPIVFISGSDTSPNGVILTHSNNFPCNVPLTKGKRPSYFTAHLIEKLSGWGPYRKIGEVTSGQLALIERHIAGQAPVSWARYLRFKVKGCPTHP